MTVCRVLLYGLKPCDISTSTNEKLSETPTAKDADFLNVDIKPLTTPTSSRSSISSDNSHESSPIRIMIRETSRGRHRICVSQTLLRTHTDDV